MNTFTVIIYSSILIISFTEEKMLGKMNFRAEHRQMFFRSKNLFQPKTGSQFPTQYATNTVHSLEIVPHYAQPEVSRYERQ